MCSHRGNGGVKRQQQWSVQIHLAYTQALFDLEATNADLKADLRDLYITSAKEVDVSSSRKAIIIHVCCVCYVVYLHL